MALFCKKFPHGRESVVGHTASSHQRASYFYQAFTFHKLVDWWDKCLNAYGRYVEK